MKPTEYLAQQQQQQQAALQTSIIATTHAGGMFDHEKIVLEEFIICYKNNRMLWDSKCGKNVARGEKDEIFNELARILSKIKCNCTVDDVKKKINALRSNYRRELRKVRKSEVLAGENKEAIFQPTLWWYELMGFLEEVERPFDDVPTTYNIGNSLEDMKSESCNKKRKCHMTKISLNMPTYTNNDMLAYNPTQAMQDFVQRCDTANTAEAKQLQVFKEERDESNQTPIAAECYQQELHVDENARKTVNVNTMCDNGNNQQNGYQQNNLLPTTANSRNFQTPHSTNNYMEDGYSYKLPESAARDFALPTGEYDTFFYLAHLWANKLRHVESRQRLFAEKAINDIIFEAELGTLKRNSVKINEI